jgi:hypothetical protein
MYGLEDLIKDDTPKNGMNISENESERSGGFNKFKFESTFLSKRTKRSNLQ